MPESTETTPVALSIAGSDSGGGAGIQADLKAFAACGVHGATALTALTAQSTTGVTGIHPVPGPFIVEQIRTVASDLEVRAVKIGMLGDAATIAAVAEGLAALPGVPVVIDPVMVSESGATLLAPDAVAALAGLLPRAAVVTPNLPEARALAEAGGAPDAAELDLPALARAVHGLGPAAVVVTGGHTERGDDLFFDGERTEVIAGERHPGGAAHGSGCTHSSALAAHLARGRDPLHAARLAREVASRAVRDGLRDVGTGAGPVDAVGLRRNREAG